MAEAIIHIIRSPASSQEIEEMLQALGEYIKLAVDTRNGILAGGGAMHADCESALLEEGSRQEDIWGADWYPVTQEVVFESLINIRPRQNNVSLEIEDDAVRHRVSRISGDLLGKK